MDKEIQKPNQYVWEVIATFLCRAHNVSDVNKIVPFRDMTYGWEIMRDNVLGVEVDTEMASLNIRETDPEAQCIKCPLGARTTKLLDSVQPKKPFIHPIQGTPMPINENDVFIYNITCRHIKSSIPIPIATRLNYVHESMAELQKTTELDIAFQEAGAIKRAFAIIEATAPEGKDVEYVPMPELRFAYQNSFFIRSMALVTESNLMNGIIHIPHDVCVAAKLPVWQGEPEPSEEMITSWMSSMKLTSDEERQGFKTQWTKDFMEKNKDGVFSESYYAVPINHVLAWGYQSEDFTAQCGHRAEQFRYIGPDKQAVVLYFLVQNELFQSVISVFRKRWMNKIDRRPLKDVAFEFLPILSDKYKGITSEQIKTVTGRIKMRSYVSYAGAPILNATTISKLAPALAPGFPGCHEWSVDPFAKTMVEEKHAMEAAAASAAAKKITKK